MKTIYQGAKLWEKPEVVGLSRLKGRSPLIPFRTPSRALTGDREKSTLFRLLNGTWKFKLVGSPAEAPTAFSLPGFNVQKWDDIEVPGNWTMQGFDRPQYLNVTMAFDDMPPHVPAANPTGLYRTVLSPFRRPGETEERCCILMASKVPSSST